MPHSQKAGCFTFKEQSNKKIMSSLELRIFPDPCLRVKTKPVRVFGTELDEVAREMAQIMRTSRGIGLAAPQVGLGLSLIVIDIGEGLRIFINPEIIECSQENDTMEEGCLSLPEIAVKVTRPKMVKVRAQDHSGKIFSEICEGLMARVIQHEMDHLQGKLLINYLNPVVRVFDEIKMLGRKGKKSVSKKSARKKL